MCSKEKQLPSDDRNAQNELYHERQVKALCALHALNNLFQQQKAFTKKDLDQICERLSPGTFINPHRSMLGLGNYDVNVLMAALQEKGYETIWFDKRKTVNLLVPENIMGFILNIPSAFHFGPLRLALHCKHWIALRRLQGQYMNLDSKLTAPVAIGNEDELIQFLHAQLEDGKKELLLVVTRDIYDANTWQNSDFHEEEIESLTQEGTSRNPHSAYEVCNSDKKSVDQTDHDDSKNCAGQAHCSGDNESVRSSPHSETPETCRPKILCNKTTENGSNITSDLCER